MRSRKGLTGFLGVGVCLLGLAVTAWAQRAGPQANGDAAPPSVLSLGEPTSVVESDGRLTQLEDARQLYEAIRSSLIEVDSAGNLQPGWAQYIKSVWSGAPLVLFGSTGNQGDMLITIDPATGAGTAVVPHGAFGPVTDIDCSPASLMYGGTGGGFGNLITIDPVSVPAESLVGANGLGSTANIALEWVDSTLYGIVIFGGGGGSMSNLVTLDPSTGLATTVGPTGMGPIGGLAYDPNAGVMYGTQSGGQSAGNFVTVDLNTGAATIVGSTGFLDVAALDFDPSTGILYGGIGGSDPNAGSLITIDPSTGAGTLVGPTGFPVLSGVTFCGAPLGACCVVDTESCTDDQAEEECDAQGGEWHVGQSCGDILCPPPCGGTNGSFETGDFSGWLTQDLNNPFFPLMVGGAGISPGFGFFLSDPTDGAFAALHGWDGDGPGTISVAQDFALPLGTTEVIFDYRAAWAKTFGATQDRTFEVAIRPEGGGPPLQPPTLILTAEAGTTVLNTGDLVGSVDVSDFDGSTVQVSFEWFVPENFTGPAFFQLDNIRCLGCGNDEDCADGDPCTDDVCGDDGECSNPPVDCSAAGDECNNASCDPEGQDGNCGILTPVSDGTACGDPSSSDCDNPDSCDGNGGCQDNNEGAGTGCTDDGNGCTDDVCDGNGSCTHLNNTDPCNDGNACTTEDACSDGACQGGPLLDCDDNDGCTADSCDPATGCVHEDIEQTLIIKQGACPTPVNPISNGVMPMLLVGDDDFNVNNINLDTLALRRCDGVGGSATPLAEHTKVKDLNHPGDSVACGGCACNNDQSSDGVDDLSLKFRTSDTLAALELGVGDGVVTLELTGNLLDGSPFCSRDCVIIVPPSAATSTISVEASVFDTFMEVEPWDLNVDGDGFSNFSRAYIEGTEVTMNAPLLANGRRFLRWSVDGVLQPFGLRTLEVTATAEDIALMALYVRPDRLVPNRPEEDDGDLE